MNESDPISSEIEQSIHRAQRGSALKMAAAAAIFLGILIAVILLLYYPRAVTVEVIPEEAKELVNYSILDGRAIFIFNRAVLIGDQATAEISAPGYISETVRLSTDQKFVNVELSPLPVRMVLTTEPALPDIEWSLNGIPTYRGETLDLETGPGTLVVDVNHPYYRPETVEIELPKGKTVEQTIELTRISGRLSLNSFPEGASVSINGETRGQTPLVLDGIEGGVLDIELKLKDHLPVRDRISITNKNNQALRDYIMQIQSASLEINVSPANGDLTVNGSSAKPASSISLPPGVEHLIRYQKKGYMPQNASIVLAPGENKSVKIELAEEKGQITIRSSPPATLLLDDRKVGMTPQVLELQTVEHTAKLVLAGYRELAIRFTPDANFPLLIEKTLQTEKEASIAEAKPQVTSSAGIKVRLFKPGGVRFTMGAPPEEPGQRANEFLRSTVLEKPFYAGVTEVTNQQFDKFSGEKTPGPSLPKTNLSWSDAARFCNWLSSQEKLDPVYRFDSSGNVIGHAQGTGYRLISEAEWEWLARLAGRPRMFRFLWGDSLEIPEKAGNFADESAKGVLSRIIPDYNDGFPGISPAGSFLADINGLHDMAGNVSEWMHDVYLLAPPASAAARVDPMGLQRGSSHVVKGSNFRTARVSEMRSSFREGVSGPRDDVGFRVARYVYGEEQ
ncbi:MAG: SUMF1/EgtB/PvdO family nonheme iron enzyme [Gammaproteobacteria bacterium]|nr:SUMF1/EgtB/PvdO family nonheme iron enzyme [Gammaproteobacteria bacterium]